MNPTVVLALGLIAVASAVSFSGNKNILVNDQGTKIVVINDDGKAVQIETDKASLHGNRLIQVQVTAPNRVTITVQVHDRIAAGIGTTQSQILADIFQMHQGNTNENEYDEILNTVANQVQQGNVNQAVLIALEILCESNNNVQAQNTLTQILNEQEEVKNVLYQQSWKNSEIDEAQQDAMQQLQWVQNSVGAGPLANVLLGGQSPSLAQKQMAQQMRLARASSGKKTVLVSDDATKIVVINENGKSVKVQTDQVGLNGNRVIQVQVCAPQRATKTVYAADEIVSPNGQSQSTVLAQIFATFQGTLSQEEFNNLQNVLANQVSAGNVNPAVLVALGVIDNDIVSAQKKLQELEQIQQFQNIGQQTALTSTLGKQLIGGTQNPNQLVIGNVAQQQAIDQIVNQQQQQQQNALAWNQVNAISRSQPSWQGLGQQLSLGQLQNQWGSISGGLANAQLQGQLVQNALNQQQLSQALSGRSSIANNAGLVPSWASGNQGGLCLWNPLLCNRNLLGGNTAWNSLNQRWSSRPQVSRISGLQAVIV